MNLGWWIVRAEFDLTLLGKNGEIVTVVGHGGLPGAACCTLYQIPPLSDYWLKDVAYGADAAAAKTAEIRITTGWYRARDMPSPLPTVVVSKPRMVITEQLDRSDRVRVTGTLKVWGGEGAKFNVVLFASLQVGSRWFGLSTTVDCVSAGTSVKFQIEDGFRVPAGSGTFLVFGYTTTMPGVGAVDEPPGCAASP